MTVGYMWLMAAHRPTLKKSVVQMPIALHTWVMSPLLYYKGCW